MPDEAVGPATSHSERHSMKKNLLADELLQRLEKEQVEVEIVQTDNRTEVLLKKGTAITTCNASCLSSAVIGAHGSPRRSC